MIFKEIKRRYTHTYIFYSYPHNYLSRALYSFLWIQVILYNFLSTWMSSFSISYSKFPQFLIFGMSLYHLFWRIVLLSIVLLNRLFSSALCLYHSRSFGHTLFLMRNQPLIVLFPWWTIFLLNWFQVSCFVAFSSLIVVYVSGSLYVYPTWISLSFWGM